MTGELQGYKVVFRYLNLELFSGLEHHVRIEMKRVLLPLLIYLLTSSLYGGKIHSYVDQNGIKVITNIGSSREGSRDLTVENPYSPEGKQEIVSKRFYEKSPRNFVFRKSAIEEILANLDSIVTQARVIPNFIGRGEERYVDGFRIYRIQPGSTPS